MDLTLAKFIVTCLVLELIGFSAAVPLKVIHEGTPSVKVKRSPADNFSFFGLGRKPAFIPQNPISNAQQYINKVGNLFTPAFITVNRNNENLYKRPEVRTPIANMYPNRETQSNLLPVQANVNKYNEFPALEIPVQPNMYVNIPTEITKETVTNEKQLPQFEKEQRKHELTSNEKPKNEEMIIDKEIIDSIFRDTNENTIDVTTEYATADTDTTETGDYESTTTDELLRIPAPVVASLLG